MNVLGLLRKVFVRALVVYLLVGKAGAAEDSKSIKLPGYDGNRETFQLWWTRFMAYAAFYKFAKCLKPEKEDKLPAREEEDPNEDADNKAARQRNLTAICNLTLAFQTERLMSMIYRSTSSDWPSGQVHLVVKALLGKYCPDDLMAQVELEAMLNRVRSKHKKEDPTQLFEQIHGIQNRFKNTKVKIEQERLVAVIMQKAPMEYKAVITAEQRRLNGNMTLDDLEDAMYEHWRVTYALPNEAVKGSNEITLVNVGVKNNEGGDKEQEENEGSPGNGNNTEEKKQQERPKNSERPTYPPCEECGKTGHSADQCWERHPELAPPWLQTKIRARQQRKERNSNENNEDKEKDKEQETKQEVTAVSASTTRKGHTSIEVIFCYATFQAQAFPDHLELLKDPNIWIADSAATVDSTPYTEGMRNIRWMLPGQEMTLCADGQTTNPVGLGDLAGTWCNNQGAKLFPLTVPDIRITPDGPFNVISTTKRQLQGYRVEGGKNYIKLIKGDVEFVFDIMIRTDDGVLFAAYIQRDLAATMEVSMPAVAGKIDGKMIPSNKATRTKEMNIHQAHGKFGHMGEDLTRACAKANGYKLTRGTLGVCEHCTVGKAQRRNLGDGIKVDDDKDRMYLDCATVKVNGKRTTKAVWRLMVKDSTGLKHTQFYESKKAMVEPTAEKLHQYKTHQILPEIMRMDNAGENKLLQKRCESADWKLGLTYEYTARNTPQQNSPVEVGFTTLTGRATAMMVAARVPKQFRHLLFPYAADTATKLDGLVPIEVQGNTRTRYEHDLGMNPRFATTLRTWGEAGTVTVKSNRQHPKGYDKGIVCMFVAYSMEHGHDVYVMWDVQTKRTRTSRDIVWLRRMYFQEPLALAIPAGEGAGNAQIANENREEEETDSMSIEIISHTQDGEEPESRDKKVRFLDDQSSKTGSNVDKAKVVEEILNQPVIRRDDEDTQENETTQDGNETEGTDNDEEEIVFHDASDVSEEDFVDPTTVVTNKLSSVSNNVITRSGRVSSRPARHIETMNVMVNENKEKNDTPKNDNGYVIKVRTEERDDQEDDEYSDALSDLTPYEWEREAFQQDEDLTIVNEVCFIGAGLGGGFVNTKELHVMKYPEAMAGPDREKWDKAVLEEHERMIKNNVFEEVIIDNVPEGSAILSSTWAMKKKANGTYRARLNARGFEQKNGEHYDEDDKAAPVVCDVTIRIVFVLMIMAGWLAELIDVRGAFLLGEFEPGHKMYMHVPQGFEKFYPSNVVLLLLKTIYGTKQAAIQFWKMLWRSFKGMGYQRSKADACLYYQWYEDDLVIWMSWVDDCFVTGPDDARMKAKAEFTEKYECDDQGIMKEYVGCKIERNMEEGWMKMTQPVILQSYNDEFDLPKGISPRYPSASGALLQRAEDPKDNMEAKGQTTYRSGVGKLLHMMRWSRPEILNRTRELSRYMKGATEDHSKALMTLLKYCWNTPNRGLVLRPARKWNGRKGFQFVVLGRTDSDYGKDPETRKSVSGVTVLLEGCPVVFRSKMQQCVTLSVTEAEMVALIEGIQDMLFVKSVIESLGLEVELPMKIETDNKATYDLSNNWSTAGRTRHICTRISYVRELREAGIIQVVWIPNELNSSDIFTKNVAGPEFDRQASVYVGKDEYMTNAEESGAKEG